jgi:prepilin-type N-terminal cleavage/methylation domain-containing protein
MGKNALTSANGFTLVEVMISLAFLLVAAMALLQGLELAFRHYALAQDRWKATVELWNQVEKIRATHSSRGEPTQIIPSSRPLYRRVLKDGRLEGHSGWEVLSADR